MFIGRNEEIKEIAESLQKHSFQGVFVYGRRRIGKTELIAQGIAGSELPVLSYEFKKTTLSRNMSLFLPYVRAFFDEPYVSFSNYDELFDFLFRKSIEKEFILVLDEFSFLLNEDFGIESYLAAAIDKYKRQSKMHLFVAGSYVGLMEKMIDQQSHSHGRFNHILPLRPFDYYESAQFYPDYSSEDKIVLYGVFGGVPYFNSLIDPSKTAIENILQLVVKADSICEHEIVETIMDETNKEPMLNELLLSIISGKHKYADILAEFRAQGKGKPDYFIDKLLDMDFIKKVCPINDEDNKKRMRYEMKDNLIDFYYRYLIIAKTKELRKDPRFYFENFIQDDFTREYIPKKFEEISKEFLIRMNIARKIQPPFFKIGDYYINIPKSNLNRQFDFVTEDKNGFIAYECKYMDAPLSQEDINEEIKQTTGLPDIHFYKLGFISKNGVADNIDASDYNVFSLSDFYA